MAEREKVSIKVTPQQIDSLAQYADDCRGMGEVFREIARSGNVGEPMAQELLGMSGEYGGKGLTLENLVKELGSGRTVRVRQTETGPSLSTRGGDFGDHKSVKFHGLLTGLDLNQETTESAIEAVNNEQTVVFQPQRLNIRSVGNLLHFPKKT